MNKAVLEAFVQATLRTMDSALGKRVIKGALMQGATSEGAIVCCVSLATKLERYESITTIVNEVSKVLKRGY